MEKMLGIRVLILIILEYIYIPSSASLTENSERVLILIILEYIYIPQLLALS